MDASLGNRGRKWSVVVALSVVLLALDFLTGPFIIFPITFVLPVVLAGWFLGRWPALGWASVLAALRFGMAVTWAAPEFGFAVGLVNAMIELVVLALLGLMADLIARQQRSLARRVQVLEGLLPICCFCKSIRNVAGTWEPVEVYLAGRTPATFSHGFCEQCARIHYPEFFGPQAQMPVDPLQSPESQQGARGAGK